MFHELYTAYSSTTPQYRRITYKPSFTSYYQNKLDTATCTGLNMKFRSQLLIYFSTVVYSTLYEFYIIGLNDCIGSKYVARIKYKIYITCV
jgi:hypothetical protein